MKSKLNANTVDQVLRLRCSDPAEVNKDRGGLTEDHWATVTHHVMTQYGYRAALKKFADGAETEVAKELLQIHNCSTFAPQKADNLTFEQRRRALELIVTVK